MCVERRWGKEAMGERSNGGERRWGEREVMGERVGEEIGKRKQERGRAYEVGKK